MSAPLAPLPAPPALLPRQGMHVADNCQCLSLRVTTPLNNCVRQGWALLNLTSFIRQAHTS